MTLVRSLPAFALVAALLVLAPAPALGQHTRLLVGTDHGIWVAATDQQLVRVTVGNPYLPDPTGAALPRDCELLELEGVQGDVSQETRRLEPGGSYTYTIDPRADGVLVNPRTGLRHVRVSFRIASVPVDPSDPSSPAPRPAVMIEILNARTGETVSFQAFPGFAGGVFVAAGDVN